MPSFCAAVGCSNSSTKLECKEKKISFHKFPLSNSKLLNEWVIRMKREDFTPNLYSQLCSEHFLEECFHYQNFTNRRLLKSDAYPTEFKHNKPTPKRKRTSYQFQPGYVSAIEDENIVSSPTRKDVGCQTEEDVLSTLLKEIDVAQDKCKDLENLLLHNVFNCEALLGDEVLFNSVTGFKPTVFETVYKFLELQELNGGKVPPKEKFFIFLVRIKSGVTIEFLSAVTCIPKTSVSRILSTMTEVIYAKLKSLEIWPSKAQVQEYMPEAFARTYPNCRVILDCTEISIQKPSNPRLQQITFSYYKNKNTLKALIGITPSGALSVISDLWCGGISDKELFLESGLLDKLENDLVLADRGFLIQKELQKKNCQLLTPHFLKNMIQFSVSQREENKRCSNLRVHVERAISRIKKYRYFKGPVPSQCFHEVNKIFFICASFTNFCEPLIKIV